MSDEQYFLANAYLDGELTDEQRRAAEADPAVMAEVAALRDLQAVVRDVAPPAAATREAAIAAAMSQFGATGSAPAVGPDVARPRSARILAIAAAVVAVLGLGLVVSRIDLGSADDDAAGGADIAEELDAGDDAGVDAGVDRGVDDGEAVLTESVGTAEAAADDESFADDAAESAVAEMIEEDGDDSAGGDGGDADVAAADTMSDAAGAAPLFDGPITIPDDYDAEAVLATLEDLAVRGGFLVRERDAQRLAPSPNSVCERLDETLARAAVDVDGLADVVDVLVAVDEEARTVVAIDARTCEELLVAPLPDVAP